MKFKLPVIDPDTKVQCVYIIKFPDMRYYIGATLDISKRIQTHVSNIKNNKFIGYNKELTKKDIVVFEILEVVSDPADLNFREEFHVLRIIETEGGFGNMLNISLKRRGKYKKSDDPPIIGSILKRLRMSKNLTQAKVSRKVGISQTHLSQIEGGAKNTSHKALSRLCDFYKIPPQFLIMMVATDRDVPEHKKEAFRKLKPAMDALIDEFLN